MDRPEYLREEHLEYLDDLRERGIVNMFGARPYLQDWFADELNRDQASNVLKYWMRTFGERHNV